MLPNFPFTTGGKILAPVTLTRLIDGPALQLVVPSWDGYVYVVDGITACAGAPCPSSSPPSLLQLDLCCRIATCADTGYFSCTGSVSCNNLASAAAHTMRQFCPLVLVLSGR